MTWPFSIDGHLRRPIAANQPNAAPLALLHDARQREQAGVLAVGSAVDADAGPMHAEAQTDRAGNGMRGSMRNHLHGHSPRPIDGVSIDQRGESAAAQVARYRDGRPRTEIFAIEAKVGFRPTHGRQRRERLLIAVLEKQRRKLRRKAGRRLLAHGRQFGNRQPRGAAGDDRQFERFDFRRCRLDGVFHRSHAILSRAMAPPVFSSLLALRARRHSALASLVLLRFARQRVVVNSRQMDFSGIAVFNG